MSTLPSLLPVSFAAPAASSSSPSSPSSASRPSLSASSAASPASTAERGNAGQEARSRDFSQALARSVSGAQQQARREQAAADTRRRSQADHGAIRPDKALQAGNNAAKPKAPEAPEKTDTDKDTDKPAASALGLLDWLGADARAAAMGTAQTTGARGAATQTDPDARITASSPNVDFKGRAGRVDAKSGDPLVNAKLEAAASNTLSTSQSPAESQAMGIANAAATDKPAGFAALAGTATPAAPAPAPAAPVAAAMASASTAASQASTAASGLAASLAAASAAPGAGALGNGVINNASHGASKGAKALAAATGAGGAGGAGSASSSGKDIASKKPEDAAPARQGSGIASALGRSGTSSGQALSLDGRVAGSAPWPGNDSLGLAGDASASPLSEQVNTQTSSPVSRQIDGLLEPEVGTPAWQHALNQQVLQMRSSDVSRAELQLNPPGLGPLRIKLSLSEQSLDAEFTADNAEVREAVASALPQLREALQHGGIQLGQAFIEAGPQTNPAAGWAASGSFGSSGSSGSGEGGREPPPWARSAQADDKPTQGKEAGIQSPAPARQGPGKRLNTWA